MDTDALVILLNMAGWVVVGWFLKQFFDDHKIVKAKVDEALKKALENEAKQLVFDTKLLSLATDIGKINTNIEKINDTLYENNQRLIAELKSEIQNLRKK